MPTELDTEMRAAAKELLDEFGANVTLYPPVSSVDVNTGEPVSGVGSTTLKASPPLPMNKKFLETSQGAISTDKLMYLSALDVEGGSVTPEVGGSIDQDSSRLQIVSVVLLWSGEQIAAYIAAVRA